MAITDGGSLGTVATKSANQATSSLTTTASTSADDIVVFLVFVDNNDTTDGDEGAVSSVDDSAGGNTWSKLAEFTNSGGAAQAGSTTSFWFSKLTNAIASGGTITANLTNNASRDACVKAARKFTVGAGNTVELNGTPATVAVDGGGYASRNVTTSNVECLRIRGGCVETNIPVVSSPTSGWTTIVNQATSGGGGATNISGFAEFRISTGTGDASLPSSAGGVDIADIYVALSEVTPAAATSFVIPVSTINFMKTQMVR